MTVLLSLATVVAIAVGYWNLRASFRAGRGADWRINRDGLRPPGTTPSFNMLHLVACSVLLALVVFGAPLTAVLAAALAYAVAFAALADRERRRAIIYYRGNVLDRPYPMPQIDARRMLLPVLAIAGVSLAWLAIVTYMPVDQVEQRNAVILSKAGPRGKAAFDAAWSDGRLTRIDMYRLRDEARHDIDAWIDMRAQ